MCFYPNVEIALRRSAIVILSCLFVVYRLSVTLAPCDLASVVLSQLTMRSRHRQTSPTLYIVLTVAHVSTTRQPILGDGLHSMCSGIVGSEPSARFMQSTTNINRQHNGHTHLSVVFL